MNYQKIYDNLIARASNRILEGYTEKHHIVPRCMGGSDDPSNLVRLTPEEHFLCHQLLLKIYRGTEWGGKMAYACHAMGSFHTTNQQRDRSKLKQFAWVREQYSKAVSESKKGKPGNSKGIPKPYMAALNAARKGIPRPFTEEHLANLKAAISKPRSEEVKAKISQSKKGVSRATRECPHCLRHISDGNFTRWHGNNCKLRTNNID